MDKIRRHIIFYGSVQGVGFRYRTYYAAQANSVTGWVRNCADGSVEAELEGYECDIDNVILQVEKGTFVRIENMNVKSVPVMEDGFFEIRD